MKTAENAPVCPAVCPCKTPCPVGRSLAMIGGKWKLRLICTLTADGSQRYNELLKKTQGITNAMLSSSLKELESGGLITRKHYETIPPKVEYSITQRGKDLWPILHQLAHWIRGEESI